MGSFFIPEGKDLRIAISGKSGCGNTTVSTLLAKRLAIPCVNYTFKNLGAELGLTVKEIVEKAKDDFSYDERVDSRQIELASHASCVLASRLAIWLLKIADFKVYLYASPAKRASRVHKREGGDLEEIARFTSLRDREDAKRYKALYNIDIDEYKSVADIVINTDEARPEKICNIVLKELLARSLLQEKN